MREPGFDEFADLWNDGDGAERAAFEAMARKARRHGRLLAYADLLWFVLLVGGSIFVMTVAPGPITTGAAVILLVATVWVTWKRRTLRQMSRTLVTTDRRSYLASSVANARADLRRVTLSLLAFPLLVPIALLIKVSLRTGVDAVHPVDVMGHWVHSTRGIVTLILLAGIMLYTVRSRMKIQAELRRLEEVRRAYEAESRLDEAATGPA